MFRAGVLEKIFQERTSYHSVKALRTYERTTATQNLSIANVLSSSSNISFLDKPQSVNGTGNGTVSVNDTRVNDTSSIPRIATMIGTASHCVINVNIGAPSLITQKNRRKSCSMKTKLPDWHTSIFHLL